MLEQGKYWGIPQSGVTGVLETTKATPFIDVTFGVTHMSVSNEWGPLAGIERTARWFMSEKAWPYTEKRLKACGFTGNFEAIGFAGEAAEKGIALMCEHEKSQDGSKTYERWDLADWTGAREVHAPDKDVLRKLNARWKAGQATSAAPSGPPPGPPQSSQAPGGMDLDADGQPLFDDTGTVGGGADIPF